MHSCIVLNYILTGSFGTFASLIPGLAPHWQHRLGLSMGCQHTNTGMHQDSRVSINAYLYWLLKSYILKVDKYSYLLSAVNYANFFELHGKSSLKSQTLFNGGFVKQRSLLTKRKMLFYSRLIFLINKIILMPT